MRQMPMPKSYMMSFVSMPSDLPALPLTLQDSFLTLLLSGLEMVIGMGLLIALSSIGKSKFDFMNLWLTWLPTSVLNRKYICFRMRSIPWMNWGKSRIKLTNSRHSMARSWVMSLTATYCCQLHQTMMPNMHQRGELIAPLPRHQRGMCMPWHGWLWRWWNQWCCWPPSQCAQAASQGSYI